MQPSPLAPARTAPRVPITSPKPPKPSLARSDERRVVQRRERLVAAWLRSLTVR